VTSDGWRVTRLQIAILSTSLLPATSSLLWAGDAVAVGYNAEGVWTGVTYYASSKPEGGKDYKTEQEAREEAERDLQKRSTTKAARVEILSSSDSTGFVAVARGQSKAGKDLNEVGRGKSQAEADEAAFAKLKEAGAGAKQKIVYRYFSHGSPSGTGD
jgi:hypothetical protein